MRAAGGSTGLQISLYKRSSRVDGRPPYVARALVVGAIVAIGLRRA